jgi:hypothetical protein
VRDDLLHLEVVLDVLERPCLTRRHGGLDAVLNRASRLMPSLPITRNDAVSCGGGAAPHVRLFGRTETDAGEAEAVALTRRLRGERRSLREIGAALPRYGGGIATSP